MKKFGLDKLFLITGKIGAGILGIGVFCLVVNYHIQAQASETDVKGVATQIDEVSTLNTQILPDVEIDEIVEKTGTVHHEEATESYVPDSNKIEKVRRMLAERRSPLAEYAEEFVRAADYYGIDYRLVAAISIVESSGGLHCFRPYNAWGWGKSGFDSWTDGIWTVSSGLSRYYELGLVTPQSIAVSYCPPTHESWAAKVSTMMSYISSM